MYEMTQSRKTNTLLILHDDAERYHQKLAAAQPADLTLYKATTAAEALPYLEIANIILGSPALVADVLPAATALQWVQSTSAGVNELCQSTGRTDYQLTNIRDVFGPVMSEYVFAHVLSLERRLVELRQAQKQQIWLDGEQASYRSLAGLTMGIMGLGSIGRHIAATAAHFGMRVLGVKRHHSPVAAVEQLYDRAAIGDFLAQLDYLIMVLPDTIETRHFMDAECFRQLKPCAVLINVGRGATLDEQALLQALRQKQLRAAVLDVFAQEPLPKDDPLWSHPDVIVTPHNSALSFVHDISVTFIENYRLFAQGQSLNNLIDFKRGY